MSIGNITAALRKRVAADNAAGTLRTCSEYSKEFECSRALVSRAAAAVGVQLHRWPLTRKVRTVRKFKGQWNATGRVYIPVRVLRSAGIKDGEIVTFIFGNGSVLCYRIPAK